MHLSFQPDAVHVEDAAAARWRAGSSVRQARVLLIELFPLAYDVAVKGRGFSSV
jgi:hypothetical protein